MQNDHHLSTPINLDVQLGLAKYWTKKEPIDFHRYEGIVI